MIVGLMMGEHAGTVIEGTVREGIIRPIGTRGFIFSCHVTLEPTSPDCQLSNVATLSTIYWLNYLVTRKFGFIN